MDNINTSGLLSIKKSISSKFELMLPVTYSKSFMEQGRIIISDLDVSLEESKQTALFNIEVIAHSDTIVTANNKADADKVIKSTGSFGFSSFELIGDIQFIGLNGNGSTIEPSKFNNDSYNNILELGNNFLKSLSANELSLLINKGKNNILKSNYSVASNDDLTALENNYHSTETRTLTKIQTTSDLHIAYDGGKKQDDKTIKLYGLRAVSSVASRDLHVMFSNSVSELTISSDESLDHKEDSKCIGFRTEKGSSLVNAISKDSLNEILKLDKVLKRTNVKTINSTKVSLTCALPDNNNIFAKLVISESNNKKAV